MGHSRGILIGIAGGSGSGKTLVAQTLVDALGSGRVVMLQEDSYYKNLAHMPSAGRIRVNFDHPDAIDHRLLANHLRQLLDGQAIEHPVYDFKTHSRKSETRRVGPQRVIILEGILVLAVQEIRELMDIRIFIDTDPDLCLMRRLKRDMHERGRTVDSVLQQYEETVRPMHLQFVEPSKRYANVIIPHNGRNPVALDLIQAKIEKLLNETDGS
jgi:uridine kinase